MSRVGQGRACCLRYPVRDREDLEPRIAFPEGRSCLEKHQLVFKYSSLGIFLEILQFPTGLSSFIFKHVLVNYFLLLN